MSEHPAEDYAFTAGLLRTNSANPALFKATCSNNLNIILSALDVAATPAAIAAPDMLDALQALVEEWDEGDDDPFWNAARAAIAKATGATP
jgi:hypothetical protein